MEHLMGYERAILIDAIASDREPGSIITLKLSELPEQVIVVGIATDRVYVFGEELSPPVANAISKAAQIVIELL